MKGLLVLLLVIQLTGNLSGETRTITGRVISEDLETLPKVRIQDSDTTLITETDMEGLFIATIPADAKLLLITWIGMEWTTIQVPSECERVEVVMMVAANYDYKSHSKIDRDRMRRFRNLKAIHKDAFNKRIFETEHACFEQVFVHIKPRLDRIRKNRA